MTFNDLMKKEEYSKVKLSGADYDEVSDVTTLTFLYPENINEPLNEIKTKLKQEVKDFLEDMGNIKLKFKQSYIDSDILFANAVEFIEKEFPYLKGILEKEDINFQKQDNLILITIDCDGEVFELLQKYDFCNNFTQFLSDKYYEDVKIELNPCKQVVKKQEEEKISPQAELLNILAEEAKLNKVEVSEIVNIYGKEITMPAKFIKDINKTEEVVIAGKISNIVSSKFVPKSQRGQENPTEKTKLTFQVSDASGSVEVILFPGEKDAEKLERITEGSEVIVSGVLSEFASKTNIKANALSLCKVLTKEVKYIWREPIKDYFTVKPQPMVDLQQMDLFSVFEEKKDYWQDGKSVVVFDFETTGLNADSCEIIEIGAVKVTNGVCSETFQTLVNPNQKLSQEITNITGINDEMLVFAPTLDKVLPDFHKFCQGCVLSAYNIGFDIKFLKNAGLKYRYKFDNEQIDTLELARQKVASLPNYKLSSVVKALDITLVEAHRALNDAIATAKVFIKLI